MGGKWEANGRQMGGKWVANGRQMGGKWEANGRQMGGKWCDCDADEWVMELCDERRGGRDMIELRSEMLIPLIASSND